MPSPRNDSPRGGEDLGADIQTECHHDGREQVGHHVAGEDLPVGAAQRARRLHELALAHREHHPAHQPRVDGEAHDGDGDHGVAEPGAQPGHDGDGEEDEGEGHQDIGEPHDEGLDPATVVAGEEPEAHAHQHRRRRGADPREQRDARAPDETAEEIAAELVGAERMPGRARRPEPARRVHRVGVGEREPGRGERGRDGQRDGGHGDDGEAVTTEVLAHGYWNLILGSSHA